jgi:hypothetical protein
MTGKAGLPGAARGLYCTPAAPGPAIRTPCRAIWIFVNSPAIAAGAKLQ